MHEILRNLPPAARVLDLGCGRGSFSPSLYPLAVTRVDREAPACVPPGFVRADAARLPFPDAVFDAVICNHSLEHFQQLDEVLGEIRRVTASGGALFVAVPDASTLTDRLYRALSAGGGHVNAFRSAASLRARIEQATGLPCRAVRTLFTSLSFLHPANRPRKLPARLLPLAWAGEQTLRITTRVLREIDRRLGTRLSIYGWAFWFGDLAEAVDEAPWSNACVRCGGAHPSGQLLPAGRAPGMRVFRDYRCPHCGTRNFYSEDLHYRHCV